jgi:predicted DNA-binding transcriptional regulator AlpA
MVLVMTDRLLSAHALATRWGLSRQRVFQIRDEDDRMPRGEPVEATERTSLIVWRESEIETYEKVSGRQRVDLPESELDQRPSDPS